MSVETFPVQTKRVVDNGGDEFVQKNRLWFWVDIDGVEVGPFHSKEEARADAQLNCWIVG